MMDTIERAKPDDAYFAKKLQLVLRDLSQYTADELSRELLRLSQTASKEAFEASIRAEKDKEIAELREKLDATGEKINFAEVQYKALEASWKVLVEKLAAQQAAILKYEHLAPDELFVPYEELEAIKAQARQEGYDAGYDKCKRDTEATRNEYIELGEHRGRIAGYEQRDKEAMEQEAFVYLPESDFNSIRRGHISKCEVLVKTVGFREDLPRVPLYTKPFPPQKPLSEEELHDIAGHEWLGDIYTMTEESYIAIARAIEAAHGIGEKK